MANPKRKVPEAAAVQVPQPETHTWLRYIGLGIIGQLLDQTKIIADIVKDVSNETQAMSMTVNESHDALKRLTEKMQGRKRPRKSVTRGRKK